MRKIKLLETLISHQERIIIKSQEKNEELHKLLDKAHFDQTEFIYINKTAHDNEVSYNLMIDIIDPIRRTYHTSKISIIPNVDINQEQLNMDILSIKSNDKYILVTVDIIDKQLSYKKTFLHNKHNNTTRLVTPQELNLYKE